MDRAAAAVLATEVAASLEAAKNMAGLIAAAQRIQHVDGIDARERLAVVFCRRQDELRGKRRIK